MLLFLFFYFLLIEGLENLLHNPPENPYTYQTKSNSPSESLTGCCSCSETTRQEAKKSVVKHCDLFFNVIIRLQYSVEP